MDPRPVYLDYNATAPVKPEVLARVAEVMTLGGNPSSVHRYGRAARAAVDLARDAVAALVGAEPEQVIFTSGATEANALGLRSLARVALGNARACGATRVIVSAIEHDSVAAAARALDLPAEEAGVTGAGVIDLDALEQALGAGGPALVAVMLANNETGMIQPLAGVAELVHAYGGWLHCDAAQAPGRIAIDFETLGADTLAVSSHKIGGPPGTGALIARDVALVRPMLVGGGQERGLRAGTENVPGIAGFGVAAQLALRDLARVAEIEALRDDLEQRLHRVAPEVVVVGADAKRLPNTTCFALAGMESETQVIALDLAGVAVSAGAACSSGKVASSKVLRAMGVADATARSAIRVSLGWASSKADIERFVRAWSELRLGRQGAGERARVQQTSFADERVPDRRVAAGAQ